MVVVVVVEQVGVDLLAHHLVGDDKLGPAPVHAANRHQAEVVEQADEVVFLGDVLSRETFLQLSRHEALRNECLDDGGIVRELLVLADEHTQLVVVHADVLVEHLLRYFTSLINIFIKEG